MRIAQMMTYIENVAKTINEIGNDKILQVSIFNDNGSVRALIIYKEEELENENK